MKYPHLLAKSTHRPDRPEGAATLRGHTALVLEAAKELLDLRGQQSLLASGLPLSREPRLRRIVLLAAATHDLGKCSDHFQEAVRHERQGAQLLRHEALSVWLCWPGQPLASWLAGAVESELDLCLALACAAGHHRKFPAHALASEGSGAGTSVQLLIHHQDFHRTLELVASALGLPHPPPGFTSAYEVQSNRKSNPPQKLRQWRQDFEPLVPPGSAQERLLAVCKALVLAADIAGSALPRSGEKRQWIGQQLSQRAPAEKILEAVKQRLGRNPPRPFQQAVAASRAPLTLVRAGCGSGKTVTAYLWAAHQHPGRQLWITYPTTGTATEGFRGYLHGTELLSRLEHSRADVDLEIFGLRDPDEPVRDQDRLDSLRVWGCEVITCTVDTVLGLVQNQRKGLYAWLGLSHSCLVFDEVHSYDTRLFGCLLRFLEALPGIPVLLMTASLPAARLQALRELCHRVHGHTLAEVDGPRDLEELPRYQRRQAEEPWQEVKNCLAQDGKVLWVSNTVNCCLDVAAEAERRGLQPLRYHSRFRYRDRVDRHDDLIQAFARPGPVLACTTQVAEMSLDLSADLLLSDLAPIPALIQRLGRLNRRSTPDKPRPVCPFIVLPFEGLPYKQEELHEARGWLERLGPEALSQRHMVEAWQPRPETDMASRVPSAWLEGGFDTSPDTLRESSPGLTVVRPEDAAEVRAGRAKLQEVTLPMNLPHHLARQWMKWKERAGPYPVPPPGMVEYDEHRGGKWQQP
jgi:CRISPR-associated endonuclease/helicase Cas3